MKGALPAIRVLGATVGTLAAYGLLRRPWLHWGATPAEVHAPLPGDELITQPQVQATRAITIDDRAEKIWPWLLQMGHGRAGWYAYDRFDNGGRASADRIIPELQDLRVGDVVPDAVGPFGFRVVALEPQRHLVFRVTIHPITGRQVDPAREPGRAYIDFSWAFVLAPVDVRRTRLLVRVRYRHLPRWWVRAAVDAYELADSASARRMLRNLKQRVEATASASTSARRAALAQRADVGVLEHA